MAWNIRTSRQLTPDLEILRHQVNVDVAPSIVLDASAVAPNENGERVLLAGTPLVKNINGQYQKYTGAVSYIVQKIVINATGGNFTLTKSAQTTAAIDYGSSAADLEEALEALSTVDDVEVTGSGTTADPYVVTFTDPANAAAITGTATNLTGGAGTITITNTGSGVAIAGILCRTERFPDGTSKSDLPSAMWNFGQWFRADRIVGWADNSAAIKAALPNCKFD